MQKPVPNRTSRQELLRQLQVVRFKKETAQDYGTPAEVKEYAAEESSILLEIQLLKIRK